MKHIPLQTQILLNQRVVRRGEWGWEWGIKLNITWACSHDNLFSTVALFLLGLRASFDVYTKSNKNA